MPLISTKNKKYPILRLFSAVFLTFFTVAYWHGGTKTFFLWGFIQFCGVVAEISVYKFVKMKFLPIIMRDRTLIFIQGMFFCAVVSSQMIFLFGHARGLQILKRLYFESFGFTLYLHIVCYAGIVAHSTVSELRSKHKKID